MSREIQGKRKYELKKRAEEMADTHRRITEAAIDLHGTVGPSRTTLSAVAKQAGVERRTLYRHFPARADLVDAVLEDAFEELIQIAEAALAEPDPWTGFVRFVDEALVLHARNRALKDVVESEEHGRELARAMRQRIRPLTEELVARAQAAGALRQDFARQDLALLFWGSDRVIELAADVAPELWRRQLGFMLDGLRTPDPRPLAHPPLSEAQLRRVGPRRRA
jgi:AcrR family transcriptional regulator